MPRCCNDLPFFGKLNPDCCEKTTTKTLDTGKPICYLPQSTMGRLYDFFRPWANKLGLSGSPVSSSSQSQETVSSALVFYDRGEGSFLEVFSSTQAFMGVVGLVVISIFIFVFLSIIYMPRYIPFNAVRRQSRRRSVFSANNNTNS